MAALFFDYWGTLVDNYSIAEAMVPYVYNFRKASWIAEEWRRHQKWMMFYLYIAERFFPHPECTEAALRHTLAKFHVELPETAIKDIMTKYQWLRPFPDVVEGLRKLKRQGHILRIVANPAKWMLEEGAKHAGICEYFDEIISSSEETKAFKPAPVTFRLGLARIGVSTDQPLWVTSHFWEVIGADSVGIKTAWVNRMQVPHDYVGVAPTYQTRTLTELADVLEQKGGQV